MNKKERKTAKLLEGQCLHCVFFAAHSDKWPDWHPSASEEVSSGPAFTDLVRSGIKIVGEIFLMLDEKDRMKFFTQVNEYVEHVEKGGDDRPQSIQDVLDMFKKAMSAKPDVKH